MLTGTPSTPATAHSTCGHSAGGAQCTCSTPRTDTQTSLRQRGCVFPNDLVCRQDQMTAAVLCCPGDLRDSLCTTAGPHTSTGRRHDDGVGAYRRQWWRIRWQAGYFAATVQRRRCRVLMEE